MTKLKIFFINLFLFLLASPLASLAYNNNAREIAAKDRSSLWIVIISILISGIGVIAGVLSFVFWLWMLIDAIKHQDKDKTMWVLIIILLSFLGAVIYYFSEKRKRKKAKKEKKSS